MNITALLVLVVFLRSLVQEIIHDVQKFKVHVLVTLVM